MKFFTPKCIFNEYFNYFQFIKDYKDVNMGKKGNIFILIF